MPKKTNKNQQEKKENRKADEIIIGINNPKKKAATPKKKKKNPKKKETQHKRLLAIVKWGILLVLLLGAILFLLSTPLFNVTNVTISGNNKISEDTIEELSGIQLGENIYRLSKKQIEQNLKQNPYIESAEIKRKLPSEIEIVVKERQATYVLELGSGFMSMNNQGYMLEMETERKGLPILTGISTETENIQVGQRLGEEDLIRLETVLKIMDAINVKGITEQVTKIDISNKQNYTLIFEEEQKTAYLGDASDIGTRTLYLKAILGQTKGRNGEIFVNGDTRK